MDFKRFLLKTTSVGNLRFYTVLQLVYQTLGACVHFVSLKVIVRIRGLIKENMHMNKPGLDNVSVRWTVQTRVS